MYILCVAGDRYGKLSGNDWMFLDTVAGKFGVDAVMTGGATGVDASALKWARHRGHQTIVADANWTKFDRAAGPIRNSFMVRLASGVVCFPGGFGTMDIRNKAIYAGKLIELPKEMEDDAQ